MRILFVTPYPPSRIRVRGFGFLMQLRHSHEVTVVTQCTSEREKMDVEVLRKQGFEVIVVQESRRQAALRSGLALLSTRPLQVAYARSKAFAQVVHQLCQQRTFDVVHVEHLRGIASMEELTHVQPIVWDAVDCISLLSQYTITEGHSLAVRTIARLEHTRTRKYEARMLNKLQHVVVTSAKDQQAMIDLHRLHQNDRISSDEVSRADIRVLPNGVDLDYFQPLQQERRRYNIVFSGKMSYHANIAAALYLRQSIMPLIWQKKPEATLTIVGSNPPKVIQAFTSDPRVEVTGFVEDMRAYVGRAGVMLSPMVYSVGIQNKVLEAMALGTPVVAAAQATAALEAHPGHDLLVATSPQEFAECALRLMEDSELRASLSFHGRKYVENRHDWRVLTGHLVDVYQKAINASSRENGEVETASTVLSSAIF